jgi:peptidoglycan/LPS O-acetylase OafA/YrhL
MAAELAFLAIGLAIYVALRSHRHPVRPFRVAILVLVLTATYFASQYGPLPPSMTAVAVSDIIMVLAVAALAAWADRRATPAELQKQRLSTR